MMKLKIPTLAEFSTMDINDSRFHDLKFAIKFADMFRASKDHFEIGDLTEKTFGLIKDYQHDLAGGVEFNNQIEYLIKFTNNNELGKESLLHVIQSINYIDNEIARISEIEKIKLAGTPSVEESMAAGDKFDHLGVYLQLRQLANNDITKIEQIKKLPYDVCFLELFTAKQTADFEKDLNRIRNQK